MTLLSEEPELRSKFSKFAPDHPFEIKHGNGFKLSNNFASDGNIKIPTRQTEDLSLIPPDVWSSKVSSRDDSRKNTITLPEEHPHEPWHVLQEEPEAPRKSRRQRARERDGFRRYPPPRTGDLGRDKIPWGRPGKRARQRGMLGFRRRILREQHGKLHASWGHNGDSRRGRLRKQKEVPRAPWERGRDGRGSRSREDDPRRSGSRRDEPRQPPSRRGEPQRSWDRRDEPQRTPGQRGQAQQPGGRRDEPRQPWRGNEEPQRPWGRRDEPQQPWSRRDKPQRPWNRRDAPRQPWSGRDELQQPWDHRDEPQRMPGRTRQAQRSWGRRDKPRQLMSRADEPQRPRSQRNRTERPWGVGNEEPRQRGRRRGGRRPWNLKDIKIARKLTKRKVRNGLRQRLAQERRAEKLKEGVSEASPSRKSEGQELKSTQDRR